MKQITETVQENFNHIPELNCRIEKKLAKRLQKFADMATRDKRIQDVVFDIHGKTGSGKTNTSLVCAFYLKQLTGRNINLFFSSQDACEFAKNNSKAIIIVDEPSLDSLSTDQMTTVSKNFQRLINTMRQKRHIVIINITRFWRFPFDLVVDRPLAMMNMKSGDENGFGRFQWIRQKKLEHLWNDYYRKREKNFGKYTWFKGKMPERMETLDDKGQPYFNKMKITINGKPNCTYEDYKNFRNNSVGDIGEKKENKQTIKMKEQIKKLKAGILALQKEYGVSKAKVEDTTGIRRQRVVEWSQDKEINKILDKKEPIVLEN